MLTLAALLLSLAAALAAALAMPRHHRQFWPVDPAPALQKRLRLAAVGFAVLSGIAAIGVWQAVIGPVACFGLATIACLAVAFGLSYATRRGPRRKG